MDKKKAIDIIMAVACCTVQELRCSDCPLLYEESKCRAWTSREAADAVLTLKKDGAANAPD